MGQKVTKTVTQGTAKTITDYLGGFQYVAGALQYFPHAEGYFKQKTGAVVGTGDYVFHYTDHLGNIRLSYSDLNKDNTIAPTEILEENNYYPFGLKHAGYNSASQQPGYKYKYNGKELQDELGLNLYDYGARNYDPALGRWMNINPLAETSRRFSPYVYALNNPVNFIDPDGMKADKSDLSSYGDTTLSMYSYEGSGDGETKWTYKDGAFSNSNGDTVDAGEEETPPDDITVGSDGKVTYVVKTGKPNRFFDEKGKQMKPNDSPNDNQYLEGNYNVGDQVFTPVSMSALFSFLSKAGIMPPSGLGLASRYGATALQSHSAADFGFNQLMSAYSETYKGTEYAGGAGNGTFYRFGNQNTLYNLGDAGNFLWGAWMSFNNFSSSEVKIGSQLNSVFTLNGFDTPADQRAISSGFNLLKK